MNLKPLTSEAVADVLAARLRNTKYLPVTKAVEAAQSFMLDTVEDGVNLAGVRNAIKRASNGATFRAFQQGTAIYVVPRTDDDEPDEQEDETPAEEPVKRSRSRKANA